MDKSQTSENLKSKINLSLIRLLRGGIYILPAALSGLCTLPFDALPFGFALLGAVGKNAPFVYIGLILSALLGFEGSVSALLIGIYSIELLLRILLRLSLESPFPKGSRQTPNALLSSFFGESVRCRILVATVSSVGFSISLTVLGGFLYYDLFALLLCSVLTPIFAFLFSRFFSRREDILSQIGFLSLCGVCMYAAAPLKFYGTSLAVLGGLFTVFYVSNKKGFVRGVLCSAVLGLVYSPLLAPIFVFSALAATVFAKISPSLACAVSFFASIGWGYYIRGIGILDGLFSGVLSACLLYSVWHKLSLRAPAAPSESRTTTAKEVCRVLGEEEFDGIKLSQMNRKMSSFGDGLSRLCAFFEELKLRFPKYGELLSICKDAFDSSCEGCCEYEHCRLSGEGLVDTQITRIASVLEKNKFISSDNVDTALVRRCARLSDILDEINYTSGAFTMAFCAPRDMSAPDYRALSKLLGKSMESEENEYKIDLEMSKSLCSALSQLGGELVGAFVYGVRRRCVFIKAKSVDFLCSHKEEILSLAASAVSFPIHREEMKIQKTSGFGIMSVCEAEHLSASSISRQVRAREEKKFCGDSMSMFKNSDGRFFSLISDGMGSGRDAAAVSEICTAFVSSMLDFGSVNSELLELLNGFLCARYENAVGECSATLDIMELDLVSGRTVFYKSGAAASYVFRGGSLVKLRCRTMPVGILEHTDIKRFEFSLGAGDVVIMMSDGVCGGEEECPWLSALLRENMESSGLERTAELIVKYAIGHGSRDDISLAMIKIEENRM